MFCKLTCVLDKNNMNIWTFINIGLFVSAWRGEDAGGGHHGSEGGLRQHEQASDESYFRKREENLLTEFVMFEPLNLERICAYFCNEGLLKDIVFKISRMESVWETK